MDQKRKHVNESELIGELSWVVRTFENGDSILKLHVDGKAATAIGTTLGTKLSNGLTYRLLGVWTKHHQYGDQFRFSSIIADSPGSRRGVVEYLRTFVTGVGPNKAEKLWEKYGAKCIEVLRDNPDQVVSDGIVSGNVARIASEELRDMSELQKTTIDLMTIFSGRGFPKKIVQRCIEVWGTQAPATIKENAFRLIYERMPGAGFHRVDSLFLDLEGDPLSMDRQMFAAWYAISSNMDGHTWFKGSWLAARIRELVGGSKIDPGKAIKHGVDTGFLRVSNKKFDFKECTGYVTETKRAEAEIQLANAVKALKGQSVKWPHHYSGVEVYERLSSHQASVVGSEVNDSISFLTGSPGTGKTFTLASIVKAVIDSPDIGGGILICAPTGKAAVRCSESMSRYGVNIRAKTIHSSLKVMEQEDGSFGFEHGHNNPLDVSTVIIDEASMCDVWILASLLSAIRPGTRVLIVGDKNQLPPVGHGAPLRDLMKLFVKRELTEIQRNAGAIVKACHAIRDAKDFDIPLKFAPPEGNMRLVPSYKEEDSVAAIEKIARQSIKSKKLDPFKDLQFIVATNKSSKLSKIPMNQMLQGIFNPNGHKASGNPYRVGDKVICLDNGFYQSVVPNAGGVKEGPFDPNRDYIKKSTDEEDGLVFVANGDIGCVLAVDARTVIIAYEFPKRLVSVSIRQEGDGEFTGKIDLAYAVTCHKMQGSQAKFIVVVIDGHGSASFLCSREWVYTALSRAEEFVIAVGDIDVMKRFCQRVSIDKRKTLLVERLSK